MVNKFGKNENLDYDIWYSVYIHIAVFCLTMSSLLLHDYAVSMINEMRYLISVKTPKQY